MQEKTIKKNIQDKLSEWLGSISDEELRKRVKENCLLSGGSMKNS
jgi:hypothetical protein